MPKKYIEREIVINDIDNIIKILKRPPMTQIDKKLVEVFELWKSRFLNTPTADVAPVKHGEWIDNITEWQCSECKYIVQRWNNTPYCPNCSAKMDGKEEK